MLTKLVYLLWRPGREDRARTRELLLGQVAPRLLEDGVAQLSMNIADPESKMRAPAPRLTREPPICAELSLWLEQPEERRAAIEETLTALGFRLAGYLVEETLYTDYGENSHATPRAWPDGARSPGVMMVTLLERPRRIPLEEWMRRWHGVMSPVSESLQPRTRYLRNLVLRSLTPGAPALQAIVEEAWPSPRHVSNPFLFYRAHGPVELVLHLARILRAVLSFLDLHRIRITPTGEYLLKTDASVPRARRSSYDRYC